MPWYLPFLTIASSFHMLGLPQRLLHKLTYLLPAREFGRWWVFFVFVFPETTWRIEKN